jgi:hypothetical protein
MACTTCLVCLVSTVSCGCKNTLGRASTSSRHITKLEQSILLDIYDKFGWGGDSSMDLSSKAHFVDSVNSLTGMKTYIRCQLIDTSWITLLLDPTVWVDGASPATTCITPSFPWASKVQLINDRSKQHSHPGSKAGWGEKGSCVVTKQQSWV